MKFYPDLFRTDIWESFDITTGGSAVPSLSRKTQDETPEVSEKNKKSLLEIMNSLAIVMSLMINQEMWKRIPSNPFKITHQSKFQS